MKKFLIITTAILVLLFVSFWGYIQYQGHASYQTRIPANTSVLIRVDLFGIGKSLVWEYLGRKKAAKSQGLKGISVPANLFIFSLKDKQSTTFFSTLHISNIRDFEQSLAAWQQPGNRHEVLSGVHILTNASQSFTLAYNDTRAVFAYSPVKEQLQQTMIDILQDKNTIAVANSAFRDIKEQDGHVTFLSDAHSGSIDFYKGSIQLQADLATQGFTLPAQVSHPGADTTNAMSLWLYAGCRPLLAGQVFKVDTFHINGDSLLAYQPKGFSFRIGQPQLQKDSVITYDYNDDFEKVATVSIVEKSVPGMVLEADADGTGLYHYLVRQHIIKEDSSMINRQVFPLYQAYATSSATRLQLSTARAAISAPQTQSNDFFGLYINFARLQQQPELAALRRLLAPFDNMEARAYPRGNNRCVLKGKLTFKEKNKNALLQLLDNF